MSEVLSQPSRMRAGGSRWAISMVLAVAVSAPLVQPVSAAELQGWAWIDHLLSSGCRLVLAGPDGARLPDAPPDACYVSRAEVARAFSGVVDTRVDEVPLDPDLLGGLASTPAGSVSPDDVDRQLASAGILEDGHGPPPTAQSSIWAWDSTFQTLLGGGADELPSLAGESHLDPPYGRYWQRWTIAYDSGYWNRPVNPYNDWVQTYHASYRFRDEFIWGSGAEIWETWGCWNSDGSGTNYWSLLVDLSWDIQNNCAWAIDPGGEIVFGWVAAADRNGAAFIDGNTSTGRYAPVAFGAEACDGWCYDWPEKSIVGHEVSHLFSGAHDPTRGNPYGSCGFSVCPTIMNYPYAATNEYIQWDSDNRQIVGNNICRCTDFGSLHSHDQHP